MPRLCGPDETGIIMSDVALINCLFVLCLLLFVYLGLVSVLFILVIAVFKHAANVFLS